MTLSDNPIFDQLSDCIGALDKNKTVWVAFSGGLDSSVLLHAVCAVAVSAGRRVCAVHVNHGLHDDAARWSQHCAQICKQMQIAFEDILVDTTPYLHLGVEGAARTARYQAFEARFNENDVVLTAHHADDQLETVLLQLFRGSGSLGLAGCAARRPLGNAELLRPLLRVRREQIAAYAEQFNLQWLHDPANDSMQFDRNYLRHELMPRLHARWPGLHATISRVAQWQSENAELLDELAQSDLNQIAGDSVLSCSRLLEFGDARLRNVLRWWIRTNEFPVPNAQVMQRIIEDAVKSNQDRAPCVSWQQCEIRKYRDGLYLQKIMPPHDASQTLTWNIKQPLELPALNLTLTADALEKFGLELKNVDYLQVKFRVGGEVMRPRGRGCQKDLKTLFQEEGVLPWLRDRIPLLYKDDQLICVWGYWIGEQC